MWHHLLEIRRRMMYVLVIFVLLFILFFLLAQPLFQIGISPLLPILKDTLIATEITSPIVLPITLAGDMALLCTAPFVLLQLWYFIAPGLYVHERRCLRWAMVGSLVLFLLGVLFCFYIILPLMLQLFVASVPAGVRFMPDMANAVGFITRMLLLFGICFQVPLFCFFLAYLGVVNRKTLQTIRPYVIIMAFTLGMLLTPPDVMSQIMLAVPLCLLYEFGIVLTYLISERSLLSSS